MRYSWQKKGSKFQISHDICGMKFPHEKEILGSMKDELCFYAKKYKLNINNNMSDSLYNVYTMTMTEGR